MSDPGPWTIASVRCEIGLCMSGGLSGESSEVAYSDFLGVCIRSGLVCLTGTPSLLGLRQ